MEQEVPEIEEWIVSDGWTLACTAIDCKWTSSGERTEDFVNELNETLQDHQDWHRNGCPE